MKRIGILLATGALTGPVQAAAPSAEEMWAVIQQQQAEIQSLKQRLDDADTRIHDTVVMVEATADTVEQRNLAPAPEARWSESTSLGGYGEMHVNQLENGREGGDDRNEIDFHRMVLFLNHRFSPRTRFYSELELEHSIVAGDKEGEYELEQAYVEHDINEANRVKAGVFLVPVGILNETHEPDTFYGVERNNVERYIVPSTWFEGGVGAAGELAPGVSYDFALTSGFGMDVDEGQWMVRDGRQEVSEANASAPAYTGRLKYTGIAGLELAATVQYQGDLYQGEYAQEVDAWLFESHAAWRHGPFGLRALWAGWNIDSGINAFAEGADRQEGWYIEPSWRFSPQWGAFARYSDWDNQAGADLDTEYTQWDLGVNYWLEENVVFKLDYQSQDAPGGKDQFDGANLGVGVSF